MLVLDEEIPWPPNTGKRIRTFELLRRLTSEFQIDLLVHSQGADANRVSRLEEAGITVHVSPSQVQSKQGLLFHLRVLASLGSRLPYSVSSHLVRGYRDEFRRLLRTGSYDLVHCEWTPYAAYIEDLEVPWVVSSHNVECEVWSRMAASERRLPLRMFLEDQARRMERFERRVFARAPYAIAVSQRDVDRIRAWGCERVRLVPNGVDVASKRLLDLETAEPNTVAFVGSMDWRANQDAMRWYLSEVHQPLRMEIPTYKLLIVGRNPPGWLDERAAEDPSVVVTRQVDDVEPYIQRSTAIVVPLRVGGGSRLKILEAFAHGRPVVSTSIGAEGLDVEPDRHLLIADDEHTFRAKVSLLLRDAETPKRMTIAARSLVEERYAWDRIWLELRAQWDDAASGLGS